MESATALRMATLSLIQGISHAVLLDRSMITDCCGKQGDLSQYITQITPGRRRPEGQLDSGERIMSQTQETTSFPDTIRQVGRENLVRGFYSVPKTRPRLKASPLVPGKLVLAHGNGQRPTPNCNGTKDHF